MRFQKDPQNDADVRHLLTLFGDLLPDGRAITHEQIEAALSLSKLSSRYKTVVSKWRRVVFDERRVYLDGRAGEGKGFICLTPDDMVRYANRSVRSAGRQVKKALSVASAPHDNDLSEDVKLYRARLSIVMLRLAAEHRESIREIGRALAPMQQLPKRAIS